MTLPLDMPRAEQIRLLILTPQHTDYLWLQALLGKSGLVADATWCPDPVDCDDLIRNACFDIIVWDSAFCTDSEASFLQYLQVASDNKPVLALGADQPNLRAPVLLEFGASDYLCRQQLDAWELARAVRCLWYRELLFHPDREWAGNDVVSGVINRDLFFERLEQAIQRAARWKRQLVLLDINIDNFRCINETFGYQKSDELVVKLARRLHQVLRRADSLMRVGGDELAIILEQETDAAAITRIVQRVIRLLDEPVLLDGQSLVVSASLGVATYPESATDANNLMRRASRAMSEAKHDPGTSYCVYDHQLHLAAGEQLRLEADLRNALRRQELEVWYQPRVDLATERVCGVECLLRWHHPRRGLVGPAEFIPAAERSGLIVPMGYWVIEQACAHMRQARELGLTDLVFAVNLSFRQFHDRRMTETIFRIIYNAGVDTRLLELELTESAMMHDPEYTRRCLQELNRLGIRFALDDFGTGFSSLSNLQRLPISQVKIDKSFVQSLGRSPDAAHIIRAIISLAHSLEIRVVAEGVESGEQLAFLRQQDCDEVQGYYYARPMPWKELVQFLDSNGHPACLRR